MTMTMGWVYLVGFLTSFQPVGEDSDLDWSPDSRWLAYRSSRLEPGAVPRPGWLFQSSPAERLRPLDPVGPVGTDLGNTIYASERSGEAWLLVDDDRTLTSPRWDHDGAGLLFGAISREPDRLVLEVSRRGFDPRPSVLATIASEPPPPRGVSASLEPSPDGRYVAVSRPWLPDLLILRADDGRKLKTLPGATLPAWSRDGGRLVYLSTGPAPWLYVVDASFGPPRAVVGPVARVGPRWSRDGGELFAVLQRKLPAPAIRGESLELVKVSVESRATETITKLGLTGTDPMAKPGTVSFTMSLDGDDLFFALNGGRGEPTSIVWFRPKLGETVSRFHPLDIMVRVEALALSPDGKTLAGRYGDEGVVGISQPGLGDVTPVVPDEAARLSWTRLLVETGRRLLHLALPPAAAGGVGVERASLIPVPGEIPKNAELGFRLRRVARIGLPVCRASRNEPNLPPVAREFYEEAGLFFELLREDWPAAARSLGAMEVRTESPDARLRLLSLRAQIAMGEGQLDRAADTIAYLAEIDARQPRRIELSPAGYVLAERPEGQQGWPSYLRLRLDALTGASKADEASLGGREPLGHRNPDNPNDGRPISVPVPVPFENGRGRLPFRP